MSNSERTLVDDWLDDLLSCEGLYDGLRQFAEWARYLNPLEREIVRMTAIPVVYGHVPLGNQRHMRETAKRLVDAALFEAPTE